MAARIPLNKRIGFVIAAMLIIGGLIIGTASVIYIDNNNRGIISEIRNTLSKNALVTLETYFDYYRLESKITCERLAASNEIKDAYEDQSQSLLLEIADAMVKSIDSKVNFVTFVDVEGRVIGRLHSDKAGDSILSQKNISLALAGEMTTQFEAGNIVKMSVRTGSPIRNSQGEIIGAISTGYSVTDSAFVDGLKAMTNNEFSVFIGDERVNTTVMQDGDRAIGTKMDTEVAKEVLVNKKTYVGQANVLDIPYVVAYNPVLDPDGNVLGAFATGTSVEDINALRKRTLLNAIFLEIALVLLVGSLMYLYVRRIITDPLGHIATNAEKIAGGDLDTEIAYESRNELGVLAKALRAMLDRLKGNIESLQKQRSQLEVALGEAREAEQIKAQFLANMSHEIRTPMNSIIGTAHLALETNLTDVQKEYLTRIHGSSSSLLRIINDILDFSKIKAGRMSFEKIKFSLRETIEDNLVFLKKEAGDKGLDFILAVGPDVPDRINSDPLRLIEIVSNLVDNAVKFTKEGHVKISVDLAERVSDQAKLKFSISDTGIGLSQEEQDRLFIAFEQADRSTTREYGGTGLGLAICKSLAELMDGSLEVESKKGQGSTFVFTACFDVDWGSLTKYEKKPEQRNQDQGQEFQVVEVQPKGDIQEFLHYLYESDMKALNCFQEVKPYLESLLGVENFKTLEKKVLSLDFLPAAEYLEKII